MKNLFSTIAVVLVIVSHALYRKGLLFALLFLIPVLCMAQQQVAKEILALQNSSATFRNVELVKYESEDLSRNQGFSVLRKGILLKLNPQAITELEDGQSSLISLKLPIEQRRTITLDLIEQDIFAEGFHVYTSDNPGQPMAYTGGRHYRGIVRGDPGSVVALSVFKNEIAGLISTKDGNLVLGKIKDSQENLHILYHDADLEGTPDWECGMLDDGIGYTKEQLTAQPGQRDPGDCIRVYVEIDDNIVTDMGGATNALNFVTSLFNQTITLYANEGITMSISEILAWTTTSPYNGTTGGEMLTAFQQNTGSINGDLGHLISFQPMGQGVAAGFNGICNSNPDLSKCFSGIFPVYAVFPVWSWSVNVTTHEMGHLIGSRHTHACVWNFNNTAIDGCAGATEGNCPLPGNPPGGGTIMSYCQNAQGIGVNFSLGFGSQPGNVIRNTVKVLGNCLSSSCTPAPPAYCWSKGSPGQPGHAMWIQSVAIESINNNSGNNLGYADFTGQSTTLNVGTSYTITMTAGNEGQNFAKNWAVWIDYNHDLDFYDAGEQVATGSGSLSVNLTFTVPASSPSVTTRMRVWMKRSDQSGPVSPCGNAPAGDVEDYTIVVDVSGGPTCADGAQNGDETGVDCGGTACPVCPTCTDGVQNGDEEGVDCGGSCPNACPGTILFGHYFEAGWDGWTDGGVDAVRYSGSRSWEGNYSINLQDNDGTQSSMTSPAVNLTGFTSLQLVFYFYSNSMENGDDFIVQYYNGSTYTTVATFIAGYGGHFANNSFWVASVTLTSSQVNFVANAKFRIQCDAGDNNDDIYIDEVTLDAFNNTALVMPGQWVRSVERDGYHDIGLDTEEQDVILYPNPATDNLQIHYEGEIHELRLISAQGLEIRSFETDTDFREINLEQIPSGLYVLMIRSGGSWVTKKFIKM